MLKLNEHGQLFAILHCCSWVENQQNSSSSVQIQLQTSTSNRLLSLYVSCGWFKNKSHEPFYLLEGFCCEKRRQEVLRLQCFWPPKNVVIAIVLTDVSIGIWFAILEGMIIFTSRFLFSLKDVIQWLCRNVCGYLYQASLQNRQHIIQNYI